jgi:hypothetical protein
MPDKDVPARKLQEAQRNLEAQLSSTIREYDGQLGDSMAFSLNLEENLGPQDDEVSPEERSLRRSVRRLVEAFHTQPIVMETGVRVYQVTAMDSDADGRFALDVKYEYAVDTGMRPRPEGQEGTQNLPSSSAGTGEER